MIYDTVLDKELSVKNRPDIYAGAVQEMYELGKDILILDDYVIKKVDETEYKKMMYVTSCFGDIDLKHSQINVRYLGFIPKLKTFKIGSFYYIIMPRAHHTLIDFIKTRQHMIFPLLKQAILINCVMAKSGIYHADYKADNLFVTKVPELVNSIQVFGKHLVRYDGYLVQVADFGISQIENRQDVSGCRYLDYTGDTQLSDVNNKTDCKSHIADMMKLIAFILGEPSIQTNIKVKLDYLLRYIYDKCRNQHYNTRSFNLLVEDILQEIDDL
jgi:hypothetical protein